MFNSSLSRNEGPKLPHVKEGPSLKLNEVEEASSKLLNQIATTKKNIHRGKKKRGRRRSPVPPPLPPSVGAEASAAAVRAAASALALAAGDGGVLATAEDAVRRLHPDQHLPLKQAGMMSLRGPVNIPTLPPRALLRPRPASTERLADALRRKAADVRDSPEVQARRMKHFLDAVITEYEEGRLGKRETPAAPARRSRPRPRPNVPRRAPAANPAAAPVRREGLKPEEMLAYDKLVREVNRPMIPNRLLRVVQKGQMIRTSYSLPPTHKVQQPAVRGRRCVRLTLPTSFTTIPATPITTAATRRRDSGGGSVNDSKAKSSNRV